MEYKPLFSRENVPRAGMIVEIPLAMAGAWQLDPVCSQIATGTTPKQTAAPDPIDEPPEFLAPAA